MSRSPIDFDRERCFELIEMYKQSDVLWNPEHKDYYSKSKKNEAWTEIAGNMECDVNVIKGKMTSLLASFRREKAKARRSKEMGKPRDEARNWFAYKSFSFLLDKKTARETLSAASVNKTEEESASSEEEEEEDLPAPSIDIKDELVRTDAQNKSQADEPYLQPLKEKRKRKRQSEDDPRLEEAYRLLKSSMEKDEYAAFGELLATKLRKLDEKLRLFVMHRINNILFEAEMQQCSNLTISALSSNAASVFPDI